MYIFVGQKRCYYLWIQYGVIKWSQLIYSSTSNAYFCGKNIWNLHSVILKYITHNLLNSKYCTMSHRKPPLPSLIMALYLLIAIFTRKNQIKTYYCMMKILPLWKWKRKAFIFILWIFLSYHCSIFKKSDIYLLARDFICFFFVIIIKGLWYK